MAEEGLTQQEAQSLFNVSGFLLLQDFPSSTQISVDAHPVAYLTNDQFQGIKLLPPGWHCLSWNVPEQGTTGTESSHIAFGAQGTVRNVLLRWFEKGEVVVRSLDRANEELVVPGSSSRPGQCSQRRIDPPNSVPISTTASCELLKSLDSRLLPFPYESQTKWETATHHLSLASGRLGRAVVAKVVGVAADSGDATLDSLTLGPELSQNGRHDDTSELASRGNLGRSEQGKRIWGKSRPNDVARFEQISDEEEKHKIENDAKVPKRKRPYDESTPPQDEDDGLLHFTAIDLRRSWPADSLGPEITRWSRDKSRLLQTTMHRSYIGVADSDRADLPLHCALLCELELAFILFVQSGNVYCWEHWKCVITLFCRSSSYLGANSEWQPHPSVDDMPDQDIRGDAEAHVAFLHVLSALISLLDDDFWSTQSTSSDEKALLNDLETLRVNISRSLAWRAATARSNNITTEFAADNLIGAWRKFSHLTNAKFGWHLDRRLDEEAEVEQDLEAEEGDDAPVVVEM